jgi:hypothetical protein
MSLTQEQRDQINRLIDCRDEIVNSLFHIECILKTYFPEEFERAIQFYLPQITTALYEDKKWLDRGDYSLQNSIDNLIERAKIESNSQSLKKFI